MEAVAASDIDTTVYFYNPNIHPVAEYEIRKEENKRFCETSGFSFIDADYDKDNWFKRGKGLEKVVSIRRRGRIVPHPFPRMQFRLLRRRGPID